MEGRPSAGSRPLRGARKAPKARNQFGFGAGVVKARPLEEKAHIRDAVDGGAPDHAAAPRGGDAVDPGEPQGPCTKLEPVRLYLEDRLALRPAEVAHALGISDRTVRTILPQLPHLRVGTAILVPTDELRRWLREQTEVERSRVDHEVDDIMKSIG